MSWATWKAEYYPVPAHKVPAKDALAHSIRKWEGLRPEVLSRHGLWAYSGMVRECKDERVVRLEVDSDSCALCWHFFNDSAFDTCAECPLAQVRGGVPCDCTTPGEESAGRNAPYYEFCRQGEPGRMLYWLKRAALREKAE